jgi:hypothetical protein
LTPEQRSTIFRAFLGDSRAYVVVGVTQTLVQQAALLLLEATPPVRLRTLDALHISSARQVFSRAARRGLALGAFVTADRALADAASQVGLVTANPEDHSDPESPQS